MAKVLICALSVAVLVACDQSPAKNVLPPAGTVARSVSPAQVGPLLALDFAIAGISDSVDSQFVRRTLGRPDSITKEDHPFDEGAQFTEWHYPSMVVSLSPYDGQVHSITITGSGVTTRRGLRVGDEIATLRKLYGPPTDTISGDWDYADPDTSSGGMHVLRMSITANRVAKIFVGWLVD